MKKSIVDVVQDVLGVVAAVLTFLGRHFGKRNPSSRATTRKDDPNNASSSANDDEHA